MKRLKIRLRCEDGKKCPRSLKRRIKKAALAVLEAEGITVPCELSVVVTGDAGIRTKNRDFRRIDKPTDVLSFPLGDTDPATGRLVLGDMVLNADRAAAQGEALGHGAAHEISYLTVHSILHLLGYDHEDEGGEKRRMRAREKIIMERLEPGGMETEA